MVRVLIVEDHPLLAEGIRVVLEGRGFEILAIAPNGREALSLARRQEVDVVLLDLILPDGDGVDVGKAILAIRPEVKILVLTGFESEEVVPEVLEAGFHGLLHKQATTEDLIEAIGLVSTGKAVLPHDAAKAMAGSRGRGGRKRTQRSATLTAREQEILALVAGGADTAEIAEMLFLSRNTVRTHVGNILVKLGVHSRGQAAALAVRDRLVEPRPRRGQAQPSASNRDDQGMRKMRRAR